MAKVRSIVLPLIIINIVIFIIQSLIGDSFTDLFFLSGRYFLARPWTIITYMFLHANLTHIMFNMYALFLFGPILEARIGVRRFLYVYFLSGIFAALFSLILYPIIFGYQINAVGASGAIMGLIGTLIMINPDLKLLFFFMIPMSLRTAGIVWFFMDLFGVFYPSGTANLAHIIGMITGLIAGFYFIKSKRKFDKKFSSKTHLDNKDMEEYLKTGRL